MKPSQNSQVEMKYLISNLKTRLKISWRARQGIILIALIFSRSDHVAFAAYILSSNYVLHTRITQEEKAMYGTTHQMR